jgi:hypothetical protein
MPVMFPTGIGAASADRAAWVITKSAIATNANAKNKKR